MSERDYSRLPEYLRPISKDTGPLGVVHNAIADTLLDLMDWRNELLKRSQLQGAEIDALAKRLEAIEAEAKRLNAVILDDVLHTLGDMKEVAAIERAATCKGCGKPLLPENAWMEDGCPCNSPKGCNSPAQADVGEAPASSQPPFAVGQVVECVDDRYGALCIWHGKKYTIKSSILDGDQWYFQLCEAPGVHRYDRFRPTPAPVEQGPTSEGIDDDDLAREFHEAYEQLAPRFGYETRKASAKPWSEVPDNNRCLMRAVMSSVMQPKLAAKDAEISRLKEERDTEARCNAMSIEQLATRTQELDAARNERTALRIELGDVKTKYCEQAKQVSSLTAKLAEAEKQLALADTANGHLSLMVIELKQQLTAATAANVERDRAFEAMEAIKSGRVRRVYESDAGRFRAVNCNVRGYYADNPTAAILAAKAAAEGSG